MNQSAKRHFMRMILPVMALMALGAGTLSPEKSDAQQPAASDSTSQSLPEAATSKTARQGSFFQSPDLLDIKISNEIARGAHVLMKWHDRIGLSRDEGSNHVTITASREEFVSQGFGYLSGEKDLPRGWRAYAGRLSRIYDEGNALLDIRNRIADGTLDQASYEIEYDCLKRVRRYANQLEADDEMMTIYQSEIAEARKNGSASSVSGSQQASNDQLASDNQLTPEQEQNRRELAKFLWKLGGDVIDSYIKGQAEKQGELDAERNQQQGP